MSSWNTNKTYIDKDSWASMTCLNQVEKAGYIRYIWKDDWNSCRKIDVIEVNMQIP